MAEDPGTTAYRRWLVALLVFIGLVVTGIGSWLVWQGKVFYAFLAVCVLGFLMLVVHGYRQDEEERR